jgi:hypothetical protein
MQSNRLTSLSHNSPLFYIGGNWKESHLRTLGLQHSYVSFSIRKLAISPDLDLTFAHSKEAL